MRRSFLRWGLLGWMAAVGSWAQDGPVGDDIRLRLQLEPLEFGFRFDDNVYRSSASQGRLQDGIYLLDLGGFLDARSGILKGGVDWRMGLDQYQRYSGLNNLKNDLGVYLSAETGALSLYYKFDLFLRSSEHSNFDYLDDQHYLGALWYPEGPWAYEGRYRNAARRYFDNDPSYRSRNFRDQGLQLSVRRDLGDQFMIRAEGSFNRRGFNRYAVDGTGTPLGTLHEDETWTLALSSRVYFASVLQNIVLERQRTHSNSFGFAHTAHSASWAAVVHPVPALYLQLFVRFFGKEYDRSPLASPDLQVGFVDEDSQDLLSARATWEWSPQWSVSLGVSRARSESTQPGMFYIKNLFSAQLRREF